MWSNDLIATMGYKLFMFYVNEKNRVIQKFPGGKVKKNQQHGYVISYLKDGELVSIGNSQQRVTQSAQKEGTCWYYAAARKRYGKFSPQPERETEIIISTYRKKCTELTRKHAFENMIWTQFKRYIEQHSLSHLTDKQVAEMMLRQGFISERRTYELLLAFFHCQQEHKFLYFIENIQAKEIIKEIMMVSQQLHYDIDSALSTLLAPKNVTAEHLPLSSRANFYDVLIIRHIWKQLGYTQAIWYPNMGVESLIEELRHYTCLVEIDVSNVTIGKGTPKHCWSSIEDPGYLVYEVTSNDSDEIVEDENKITEKNVVIKAMVEKEEEEEEEIEIDSHIIRIIGADLNYVYFIDPNDASKPDEARPIHQISYPLFCDILLNGCGKYIEQCSNEDDFVHLMYHIKLEDTLSHTPVQIRKRKNNDTNISFKITYADEVPITPQRVDTPFVSQSNSTYNPTMFSNHQLTKMNSGEHLVEIRQAMPPS